MARTFRKVPHDGGRISGLSGRSCASAQPHAAGGRDLRAGLLSRLLSVRPVVAGRCHASVGHAALRRDAADRDRAAVLYQWPAPHRAQGSRRHPGGPARQHLLVRDPGFEFEPRRAHLLLCRRQLPDGGYHCRRLALPSRAARQPLHLLPQLFGHLVSGGLDAGLRDPASGRLHADRDHDAFRLLPARSGGDDKPCEGAGKRGAETGIVTAEQGPCAALRHRPSDPARQPSRHRDGTGAAEDREPADGQARRAACRRCRSLQGL